MIMDQKKQGIYKKSFMVYINLIKSHCHKGSFAGLLQIQNQNVQESNLQLCSQGVLTSYAEYAAE